MKPDQIIRAWKDEEYRTRLNHRQRSMLPDNPAGLIELSEDELGGVAGGTDDEAELLATPITTIATSIPCVALGTVALSCFPACGSTVWKGTCALVSVGCCPA
jgi:mersacidin/lichenicidin family type 2 lantibiotic